MSRMDTSAAVVESDQSRLLTDDQRWQALLTRDATADGTFYYSVKTTGVYCRNVCPARLPLRKHVRFHETCQDAEQAGFRPCKRCRPTEQGLAARHAVAVTNACRMMEASEQSPPLTTLANAAGLSVYHFHRVFKAQTGITPKAYFTACRARRVRDALPQAVSVTAAMQAAGIPSSGRFYESAAQQLGMNARAYRAGGRGSTIHFAVGECWLGAILVASSTRGVCAILIGDEPDILTRDLQDRFPHAELIGGDRDYEQVMAHVIGCVNDPSQGLDLPLDIRGTAFQQRVWQALRAVPHGSTVSYAELARHLGQPKAIRAVASACAANALAVAIPCHRVIRTDGTLSGYRWGIERKRHLLARESSHAGETTKVQALQAKKSDRRPAQ